MKTKEELRKCDICNKEHNDNLITLDYENKDENKTIWICSFCTHKRFKDRYELITETHNNESNSLIVENYPYGFRLRTTIRYWIETTKRGDRFVSQTLNPKTNLWNKPKKSTYSDVMVLTKEKATNHIKSHSWSSSYTNQTDLNLFIEFIGSEYLLNELQQTKLKEGRAIYKTREYISFEIKPTEYKHKVTGEIKTELSIFELNDYEQVGKEEHEQKQKKIKEDINKLHYIHLKQEGL